MYKPGRAGKYAGILTAAGISFYGAAFAGETPASKAPTSGVIELESIEESAPRSATEIASDINKIKWFQSGITSLLDKYGLSVGRIVKSRDSYKFVPKSPCSFDAIEIDVAYSGGVKTFRADSCSDLELDLKGAGIDPKEVDNFSVRTYQGGKAVGKLSYPVFSEDGQELSVLPVEDKHWTLDLRELGLIKEKVNGASGRAKAGYDSENLSAGVDLTGDEKEYEFTKNPGAPEDVRESTAAVSGRVSAKLPKGIKVSLSGTYLDSKSKRDGSYSTSATSTSTETSDYGTVTTTNLIQDTENIWAQNEGERIGNGSFRISLKDYLSLKAGASFSFNKSVHSSVQTDHVYGNARIDVPEKRETVTIPARQEIIQDPFGNPIVIDIPEITAEVVIPAQTINAPIDETIVVPVKVETANKGWSAGPFAVGVGPNDALSVYGGARENRVYVRATVGDGAIDGISRIPVSMVGGSLRAYALAASAPVFINAYTLQGPNVGKGNHFTGTINGVYPVGNLLVGAKLGLENAEGNGGVVFGLKTKDINAVRKYLERVDVGNAENNIEMRRPFLFENSLDDAFRDAAMESRLLIDVSAKNLKSGGITEYRAGFMPTDSLLVSARGKNGIKGWKFTDDIYQIDNVNEIRVDVLFSDQVLDSVGAGYSHTDNGVTGKPSNKVFLGVGKRF